MLHTFWRLGIGNMGMWGRFYVKQKKFGRLMMQTSCNAHALGESGGILQLFRLGFLCRNSQTSGRLRTFSVLFFLVFLFLESSRAEVPMSIRRILRSRFFFLCLSLPHRARKFRASTSVNHFNVVPGFHCFPYISSCFNSLQDYQELTNLHFTIF